MRKKNLIKTFIFLIIVLILILVYLNYKFWYHRYSLETDKITISVMEFGGPQNPITELRPVVELTNKKDIERLIETVNFSSWKRAKGLKGEPEFFIDFNNGTMIYIYREEAYGFIMKYDGDNANDAYMNSTSPKYANPYYIPDELLMYIKQLVESNIEKN